MTVTETYTTDQVAELFHAKLGHRYNGTPQPFHNVRVEATGYVRTHGRQAGGEVFLVHHDGSKPDELTAATSWYEPGAMIVVVRDGAVIYSDRLGATLQTPKALAARERKADALLAEEDELRPAAVMSCQALPGSHSPLSHGFYPLEPAERMKLKRGALVIGHGHGRWRVCVVTNVTRTGTVEYLFATPSQVKAARDVHQVPLTRGRTKAGDSLYAG